MVNVFNISGGKTSAYMVLKYATSNDILIFCDTGREMPQTYKFLDDFEKYEGFKIHRISYKNSENPFKLLLSSKKYKIIPNRVKRICTIELKVKTAKRYLRFLGIQKFNNYIGFRYDEPKRVLDKKQYYKKVNNIYPLFNDKTTKDIVNNFWDNKPYNLYIPSILGNCDLCFMKGKNAIIAILTYYPQLAQKWIDDEKNANGRTYLQGITIQQCLSIANNNLFKDYSLENINPAYNCACTT